MKVTRFNLLGAGFLLGSYITWLYAVHFSPCSAPAAASRALVINTGPVLYEGKRLRTNNTGQQLTELLLRLGTNQTGQLTELLLGGRTPGQQDKKAMGVNYIVRLLSQLEQGNKWNKGVKTTGSKEVENRGNKEVKPTGNKEVKPTGNKEVKTTGNKEKTTGKKEVKTTDKKDVKTTGNKEVKTTGNKEVKNSLQKPKRGSQKKNRVVVLSMHRSGSSFTAEILGRHPEVYYLFEPLQLYPMNVTRDGRYVNALGDKYIQQVLNCNMGPLIEDIRSFKGEGQDRIDYFGKRVFCQKFNDRVERVTIQVGNRTKKVKTECEKFNFTHIEGTCMERPNVVTKLVSLTNFTTLLPLVRQGVKLLHLVRDPRGQMQSIDRLGKHLDSWVNLTITQRARNICSVLKDGLELTKLVKSNPLFRKHYRRVRYEDIMREPPIYSRKMYQFAGIKWHDSIREWLNTTTMRFPEGQHPINFSYQKAWAWRDKISYDQVSTVQAACPEVFKALGYALIKSEKHLRNVNQTLHGRPQVKDGWL